mgnify:FL=1|jgi:uncharacterized protein (DUF924 family)
MHGAGRVAVRSLRRRYSPPPRAQPCTHWPLIVTTGARPISNQQTPAGSGTARGEPRFDPRAVRDFWFGDGALDDPAYVAARINVWFRTDFAFDAELRERFGALVEHARRGGCREWLADPQSAVALVIVLDQLPRNIYRGQATAFASDAAARDVARRVLDAGSAVASLSLIERVFLYMPFEHAEDLALQDFCVAGYRALHAAAPPAFKASMISCVEAGEAHRDVIRRFGRFPHRNPIVGRESTPEELAWAEGHHGWGQGAAVLMRADASEQTRK